MILCCMDVISDWNLGNMICNGLITLWLCEFSFVEIRSFHFTFIFIYISSFWCCDQASFHINSFSSTNILITHLHIISHDQNQWTIDLFSFMQASCNRLPLIAFHFINMCIIYLIMPLLLKHAYATFSTVCVSYLIVVNSNGVTCECNMSFSYLETWQHGSNVTSIK